MAILKSFVFNPDYTDSDEIINNVIRDNKCNYEEAMKICWDKSAIFSNETRYILSLYTRLFPKYKTEDCKGLIINVGQGVKENKIINCMGLCEINVEYNWMEFLNLSNDKKKIKTLKLLMQGIYKAIEYFGWDKSIFEDTYNKVIELNYINEWYWKKSLLSPTKEYSAAVFCEHNMESFDVSIVIKNRKKEEIKRTQVLSIYPPDELVYRVYLGKLKWISDDTVTLIDDFEEDEWKVKI